MEHQQNGGIMMTIAVPFCARDRVKINNSNSLLLPTTHRLGYELIRMYCAPLTLPCPKGIITFKNQYIHRMGNSRRFSPLHYICIHTLWYIGKFTDYHDNNSIAYLEQWLNLHFFESLAIHLNQSALTGRDLKWWDLSTLEDMGRTIVRDLTPHGC
jgi:hypothetical protein